MKNVPDCTIATKMGTLALTWNEESAQSEVTISNSGNPVKLPTVAVGDSVSSPLRNEDIRNIKVWADATVERIKATSK